MKKVKSIAAISIIAFMILQFAFPAAASGSADIAYKENEESIQTGGELQEVYLGGIPFGVKLYSGELTVIGFCDIDTSGVKNPAYLAGIRENDRIVSIDSIDIKCAGDISEACDKSQGKKMNVTCERKGEILSFSFAPSLSESEQKYKTGMWVKDSTAGIGTVTYIVPETLGFAGLGHAVCNGKTGEIEKISKGNVMNVEITGVEKGREGKPGELIGSFSGDRCGTLISNTQSGVYGFFSSLPSGIGERDLIPVGDVGDVAEGDAYIRCTLNGAKCDSYSIRIAKVFPEEDTNKNMIIEITDPRLINASGGIVQGMSGSPIIQGGKLVGAVTHVFVSDPTKGYGISIEKMEDAMPDILV